MKNYLLIGGSYGIGLTIAEMLAENSKVFVASRTRPELEIENVSYINYDADNNESIQNIPDLIDGLVFLPGTINLRPFKNLKIDGFAEDFRLNVLNLIKIVQDVLPNLLAAENASVVAFSSVAATTGLPFHTSVSTSKAAIEGFARAFAAEFAPKIRMNVIAPSLTDTPLAKKFLNNESKQEKSAARHPLKRFGKPEDIAEMAVFLLGEKSTWISGQVFHVDGGMSTLQLNG